MIQTMRAVLRDIARGRTETMGGFANLKNDFDEFLKVLEPRRPDDRAGKRRLEPAEEEKFRQDCFRFLYLRSLFEIAGNLDTIALCQRALVEQADKNRQLIEVLKEKLEATLNRL